MKMLLRIIILSAIFPVYASDCKDTYSAKLKIMSGNNPTNEATLAYCSGKTKFKALSGIEYLILDVPDRWLKKNINIEELYYQDGIECDEQHQHLNLQDSYVRSFNIQMVKCLESGNACCPNTSFQPTQKPRG